MGEQPLCKSCCSLMAELQLQNSKPRISFVFCFFAVCNFYSTFAQHTFSICAEDTATGIVGSAGASCISSAVIISDVHPGVGVIHTQAQWDGGNQNTGRALMNAG